MAHINVCDVCICAPNPLKPKDNIAILPAANGTGMMLARMTKAMQGQCLPTAALADDTVFGETANGLPTSGRLI